MSSGMGRDFRSSLGAGFDSGLSGFDFTMIVLLFLLLPPAAVPEDAWKIVGQALKRKTHWRLLNSPKVAHYTQHVIQASQTGASQKYRLSQMRMLCNSAQEWPIGHSLEGLCRLHQGVREHFANFFNTKRRRIKTDYLPGC
jgi:hypothetical protein